MKKIFTLLFAAMSAVNIMAASDDNVVKYDFEHFKVVEDKFNSWYELNEDGSEADIWASGNLAFAIMNEGGPETYPTASDANGYEGACVKLETKSTGFLGAMFGMPIAAGNLFVGELDAENCVMDPLGSTKFGIQFNKKPLKFTGYYKYKAGETLTDKSGSVVEGKTDKGSIYSVLYRNTDVEGNPVVLNGNDVLTSPQIVAIANVGEITDVEEWTKFEVDYNYGENEIDADLLKNGGYNLAVVFSSSAEGASFIGAENSTLYVDKVAIECEPKEYKGSLVVTLGESSFPEETTSIYITKQADGKYTLSLKNFMLMGSGVGTIVLKDVEGTEENGSVKLQANQEITIEAGDDPNVKDWMGPNLGTIPVDLSATMSDTQLEATITINILGGINVVFNGTVNGISNTVANGKNPKVTGIYTLNGVKVNEMQTGKVYIIRKADGTTTKVIKK